MRSAALRRTALLSSRSAGPREMSVSYAEAMATLSAMFPTLPSAQIDAALRSNRACGAGQRRLRTRSPAVARPHTHVGRSTLPSSPQAARSR